MLGVKKVFGCRKRSCSAHPVKRSEAFAEMALGPNGGVSHVIPSTSSSWESSLILNYSTELL
jgi:hypothetical protein